MKTSHAHSLPLPLTFPSCFYFLISFHSTDLYLKKLRVTFKKCEYNFRLQKQNSDHLVFLNDL